MSNNILFHAKNKLPEIREKSFDAVYIFKIFILNNCIFLLSLTLNIKFPAFK